MAKRQTRHGYSLVELMIVVSIVGVSIAAAAPAFTQARAQSRSAQAVRELVRMGRRARSETAAYMRSHLIWISPQVGGGFVSLIRGNTSSCAAQDWQTLFSTGLCGYPGSACLEQIDLSSEEYRGLYTTEVMFESTSGGAVTPTATALCYAPDGVVWHNQPGNLSGLNLSDTNANPNARGGYRFVVRMLDDAGAVQGVVRRMIFPLGAPARSL